ncbi:NAD(P)H-dependent glycerol-3-phosphate dehydrogenase [Rubrivivax benzoatilyticus]|uniref:Glycerol-3-phosphate dehydrogenase [NAD(P)+] n=1 Tax=Rubrivivax benzoatilyticus TaxID=316997 RepID=A0ABX0HS57_9BURK|nr:NAD(P)H-dependent glycerol-3-phosphate dehydrogenase [Rubrivivax benzoatilyticus]EGJ08699.1 NAD(P)H-dependent glycerol-3-phosphate dehydrogenase [Rubrivivax benzoatilyticus JA2 = ATCC BAA-35]NHK97881.1 NAD(P)-dependent glycerol-3-phosphate dehydrogenase [Rubrivivax benzoatilyticus]NHL23383.1 NAD(P)-dependent glycerol-3-phosphate dehydrogenase [Rubrivivax benzoatilyticus]
MKIAVLGAGAWGTALAAAAAPRHEVLLWTRDAAQAAEIAATGRNTRYLGDEPLPAGLRVSADRDAALAHCADGLLVIATPMAGLREHLGSLPDDRPALWACKGFESGTGLLGHEIARELRPGAAGGVLSGPSFALEVLRGQPTALVAASESDALAAAAVEAFHSDTLRVYTARDIVGVEVGGAVKNVLAIATGIGDGLAATGLNARAALVTRGLAEMTRLGVALGGQAATFMGLSGLGDLVLTATGDLSRNRKVGLALAAGKALPDILAELGHVSEGVYSAATVLQRARALGVEMPITEAVVEVLEGRVSPETALRRLMGRQSKAE